MRKIYSGYFRLAILGVFLILATASCKKDHSQPKSYTNTPGTIGLYESGGSTRQILIPVTKIGNQDVSFNCIFDTGSAGLAIDAHGILPPSMITSSGIQVPGDSVVVNGITVTAQQLVRAYGNNFSQVQESGNLAYASITIGDQYGNMKITRVPIFLYYQDIYLPGRQPRAPHQDDVFGVAPGVSNFFGGIGSPLSYIKTGGNLISGFKLALLKRTAFTVNPTYIPSLLTVGLSQDDLSSSGFVMHNYPLGDSSPWFFGDILFSSNAIKSATMMFDTGSGDFTILECFDPSIAGSLAPGTTVKLTSYGGFNYQYTTGSNTNKTEVEYVGQTQDVRSIFCIDFFIDNEYLVDYTHQKIGLKNN